MTKDAKSTAIYFSGTLGCAIGTVSEFVTGNYFGAFGWGLAATWTGRQCYISYAGDI